MTPTYNPLSLDFLHSRYDHYAALRRSSPVYFCEAGNVWVVSRAAEINEVLNNPGVYSSSPQQAVGLGFATDIEDASPDDLLRVQTLLSALPFGIKEVASAKMMISEDPPRHTLMRRVFGAAFLPGMVRSWADGIQAIVEPCAEKFRSAQTLDVIADIGVPVPLLTLVKMLGADTERAGDFKAWTDEIISVAAGAHRNTEGAEERLGRNLVAFSEYFRPLIDQRRAVPGVDLISLVLKGQDSQARVTDFEVVLFVILLLIAGSETSANLIANTVYELLQNEQQLKLVIEDHSRIPAAIEETLRYRSPIQQIFRKTTADTDLAGQKIPRDSLISLLLGSGNRDEAVWADAEVYDLSREPRRHLGFGTGAHVCLGMHIAKLEARIALEGIVDLLPQWQLGATDHLLSNYIVWDFETLPLVRKSSLTAP